MLPSAFFWICGTFGVGVSRSAFFMCFELEIAVGARTVQDDSDSFRQPFLLVFIPHPQHTVFVVVLKSTRDPFSPCTLKKNSEL